MQRGCFLTEGNPNGLIWLFPNHRTKDFSLPRDHTLPALHVDNPSTRRKRRLRHENKLLLKKSEDEIRDAELENWLQVTGRYPESRWSIQEKRSLKKWFDQLDRDGSGEIDIDELADPLLSAGLAKTVQEVKKLIDQVDEDGSGTIGFTEFLTILRSNNATSKVSSNNSTKLPPIKTKGPASKGVNEANQNRPYLGNRHKGANKKTKKTRSDHPIVKLQALQKQNGDMDINSVLAFKRRKLLLDATMGEAERRENSLDEIRKCKAELKSVNGVSKFRKIKKIVRLNQHLEAAQIDKENFVAAMRGMVNKTLETEVKKKSRDIRRKHHTVRLYDRNLC